MFELLSKFRSTQSPLCRAMLRRLNSGPEFPKREELFEEPDDSNWTQISCSGAAPPVRSGHSAIVVGNKMLIFGGYNGGECHNDLYAFDLDRHHWEIVDTGKPPAGRASHCWCLSSDKKKIYVFGGSGPQWGRSNMGRLLELNLATLEWAVSPAKGNPPHAGYGHSIAALGSDLIVFGGTSGHIYENGIYKYDTITGEWQFLHTSGQVPSARYKHQAVVVGRRLFVIGGGLYDPPPGPIDIFELDYDTLKWTKIVTKGPSPRSRIAHTTVQCDKNSSRVLMFGGRDEAGARLNDFWQLDINEKGVQWTKVDSIGGPCPRDFHAACTYNGQMFVFGGSNGHSRSNDVYRYRFTFSPPTLTILAMKAIRAKYHMHNQYLGYLPAELRVGIESLNPHVDSPRNMCWPELPHKRRSLAPSPRREKEALLMCGNAF